MADLPRPAKAPCGSCPYRRDVPAGVWAAHEYEKLPGYDGSTLEQICNGAVGLFFCHQRTGNLCAGWVGCHDMEHAAAVRLSPIAPEAYDYESPVPLFGSGQEAAEHGLSGIEEPDEQARRLMAKLERKLGLD
jgi:hypothetical protein